MARKTKPEMVHFYGDSARFSRDDMAGVVSVTRTELAGTVVEIQYGSHLVTIHGNRQPKWESLSAAEIETLVEGFNLGHRLRSGVAVDHMLFELGAYLGRDDHWPLVSRVDVANDVDRFEVALCPDVVECIRTIADRLSKLLGRRVSFGYAAEGVLTSAVWLQHAHDVQLKVMMGEATEAEAAQFAEVIATRSLRRRTTVDELLSDLG